MVSHPMATKVKLNSTFGVGWHLIQTLEKNMWRGFEICGLNPNYFSYEVIFCGFIKNGEKGMAMELAMR